MAQNLPETHNSRDFRKILILSLSLSLESRSCWNANAGEILPAGSRPRLCKIRTLSSISRFENESPKKLPSLPSLGLDSRSRFIDLSVHSQPWPNRYGKRGACAGLSYSVTPSVSQSISHWWARRVPVACLGHVLRGGTGRAGGGGPGGWGGVRGGCGAHIP